MTTPATILIIASDANVRTYLQAMFQQAGYATLAAPSGKEGLIEAWRGRPAAIIVDLALPDLNGLDLIRKLRADARTAESKMLILSDRATPADLQAGLEAGANEYVAKRRGADAELLKLIQRQMPAGQTETAGQAAQPAGKLISFLSAKGGTGTSSLCTNMAHMLGELVERTGKSVAVVDLVLPIGSISQIVGVDAPPMNVIEMSKLDLKDMPPDQVRLKLVDRPPWKFHLLPGAPDPETAQGLAVNGLEGMFTALRQTFDYVVVDFGRTLSRISVPFIVQSARIVFLLSSDPGAVALTETVLRYLEIQHGLRRNRIYPVLNRAVGLEGINRTDMEKRLMLNIPGMIPYLGDAFSLANIQHVPLAVKIVNNSTTYQLQELTGGLLSQVDSFTAE